MKKENGITKIRVIIGIVLSMLVGRVMSSGHRKEDTLSHMYGHTHKYMPISTIVSETDKLRLEDYAEEDAYYTFVKNISTDENDELNSKNTTDIIVIDIKKYSTYFYNFIHTCFYREVEENGEIKKKYIPYEETTGEEKKILIVSQYTNPKIMAQIQEAKNRLANPEQDAQIKEAIELMKRILNQFIYRLYTDNPISSADPEIKHIKSLLEKIGITKTSAYSLFNRTNICNIQSNLANLFESFEDIVRDIEEIPHKDDLFNPITKHNEKRMKRIFTEENRIISTRIMDRKQNYDKQTAEDIRKDFSDDLIMFINMLTEGKANIRMYISKEELENKIEKIEDEEIKVILHEAVNECSLEDNGKLFIDKLRSKINNSNLNLFYLIVRKQMKIDPITSKETEDITRRVNKMFNSIISSINIEINLKLDEIVKEAKPWNRDLINLMYRKFVECIKSNGTVEELTERITADNVQIASELLNNRQKKYDTHKGVFAIKSIVNNELKQIKSIIEKRKDTTELEKEVAAEENKQIITLVENILSKPEDATEEEKQVRKALEYISGGEYSPEEDQRITEVLDKIARREYTLKEEQKEKNIPQKDTQKDIRSILSEIAEEFIKDEDYQVADKKIYGKKQKIVDMVVEKLPIVIEEEDSNLLRAREIFRDIIETIADVLIGNTIDRTQHKGFRATKEEIEKEAKYINSQDLEKSLSVTFGFFKKYTDLDSDGCLFSCNFDSSFSYTYITEMTNIFIREHNEAVNILLSIGSYKKLIDFLSLFNLLCKIDEDIDNFKSYNDFWLNPASFYYSNGIMNSGYEFSSAYITYKNTIYGDIKNTTIALADDNFQAFKRARTGQDIEKI